MGAIFDDLKRAIRAEQPVALATVIDGPGVGSHLMLQPGGEPVGTLGNDDLDRVVTRDALGELESGRTGVRHYGARGEANEAAVSVFIESYAPPPRMLIFGAVDFTAALTRVAKILGYRVTVCDARAKFVTPERFPDVDDLVIEWPDRFLSQAHVDERTVICVLTHDHKFDVPVLKVALSTDAGYIGAAGLARIQHKKNARLAV